MRKKNISPSVGKYRNRIFRTYVILATAGFGTLAFEANRIPYFKIDLLILNALQNFHPAWFDFLMKLVSIPGNPPGMLILFIGAVLSAWIFKFKWESICFSILGVATLFLENFLKDIVQRSRPAADLVKVFIPIHNYSFPSGHVLSYVTYFGFLIFLVFSLFPSSKKKIAIVSTFSLLIGLVGLSRVYLGEHWPSDILGAYLIGSALLLSVIEFYLWGQPKFFKKSSGSSKSKF